MSIEICLTFNLISDVKIVFEGMGIPLGKNPKLFKFDMNITVGQMVDMLHCNYGYCDLVQYCSSKTIDEYESIPPDITILDLWKQIIRLPEENIFAENPWGLYLLVRWHPDLMETGIA